MKKNRWLIVFPSFGMTGSSIYLSQYIATLISAKREIHILMRKKDNVSKYFTSLGCKVHYLDLNLNLKVASYDIKYSSIKYFLIDSIRFIIGIILSFFFIVKIDPKVVLVGDIVRPQTLLVAKILLRKTIGVVQTLPTKSKVKKIFLTHVFKKVDILIGITKYHILPFSHLIDTDFRIIPNTDNQIKYSQNTTNSNPVLQLKTKNNIVTCLSGIQEDKGTFEYLQAVNESLKKRDDITFVLAGKSSDKFLEYSLKKNKVYTEYETLCFNYILNQSLDSKIIFLGEIDYIFELINVSDVIISLNIVPHFSRPIIESMSQKKPVIASDDFFNRDIIISWENGCLVNPEKYEEIYNAINYLLMDKNNSKIGEAGYLTYKNNYSIKRIDLEITSLINKIDN